MGVNFQSRQRICRNVLPNLGGTLRVLEWHKSTLPNEIKRRNWPHIYSCKTYWWYLGESHTHVCAEAPRETLSESAFSRHTINIHHVSLIFKMRKTRAASSWRFPRWRCSCGNEHKRSSEVRTKNLECYFLESDMLKGRSALGHGSFWRRRGRFQKQLGSCQRDKKHVK